METTSVHALGVDIPRDPPQRKQHRRVSHIFLMISLLIRKREQVMSWVPSESCLGISFDTTFLRMGLKE